ncbi:MAG: protein-L-isoaspartate(D-aspartate) O-methyltransferase [Phycisphaerae bacterium]|nr:protein-L-isoaspartate(D-aspartate) O-methyltransferase [Phycisphaerae bacterium]
MPASSEERNRSERERMVAEQLAQRGIRSEAVLAAMRRIPRELFLPAGSRGRAYADGAQPIDCGQTISQPYMVGRMTELLEPRPELSVLEIGTGSGYQTAILACVAKHVYTVEWHLKLMNQASRRLEKLRLKNVSYRCGDGSLGWPERAPYEAIIVTAGAPDVPEPLCEQLAVGGRLVVPVGPTGDQTLVLVRKTEEGAQQIEVLKCRFVKLLGAAGWRE